MALHITSETDCGPGGPAQKDDEQVEDRIAANERVRIRIPGPQMTASWRAKRTIRSPNMRP